MLRLTTTCNSACWHCTVADVPAEQTRSPAQALAEIVRGRREQGCDELVFMRGEPTLRPDLPKLAAAARRLGYRLIQIQTNGRMLCYPPYLRRLLDAGVNFFEVALFGANAATHDAISRDEGAFEQTRNGLRALGEHPDVGHLVSVGVLAANLGELTDVVDLVADLGLRRIQFNFTRPVCVDGVWRTEPLARLDEAGPAIRAALRRARERGVAAGTEAVPLCHLDPDDRPGAERASDFVDVRVVDLHRRHASFARHHRQVRPRGPDCPSCALVDRCPTTWAAYQQLFGTDELRPLATADAAVPWVP